MQKFRPCLTAILLTSGIMLAPVSVAETAVQTQQFADQSVEDMVAIAKASQQNEAINDAVLGNQAIRDTLPQVGGSGAIIGSASDNTAVATDGHNNNTPPRQSNAPSVDANELVLNSLVVDQANILSASEKSILSQKLRSIYNRGLAQAAVVIVSTTNGQDTFTYALEAAEKWGLGSSQTDDGLLIFVAVNDRDVRILTGYGLEGVIPDAAASRIIREDITPYFKKNAYGQGLIKGINRIEERLLADPDILAQADAVAAQRSSSPSVEEQAPSLFSTFLIAFILGMFLTSILGRILGSLVATGGFVALASASGASLILVIPMVIFLWMFLSSRGSSGGGGKGGRGGRGGRRRSGVMFFPGGGFGGGGFGGGGFGGGGFGGGGFGGGGGGFGGGGAGGSW